MNFTWVENECAGSVSSAADSSPSSFSNTFGVRLDHETWHLPKDRLCAQSGYFKRLIDSTWQESNEGVVELDEEADLEASECMLRFLAADPKGSPRPTYSIPECYGSSSSLSSALFHARVFNNGDLYDIPALRACALRKFKLVTTRPAKAAYFAPFHQWCLPDQLALIDFVYGAGQALNKDLRDEILASIHHMLTKSRIKVDRIAHDTDDTDDDDGLDRHWPLISGIFSNIMIGAAHWPKYAGELKWRNAAPREKQKCWDNALTSYPERFAQAAKKDFKPRGGSAIVSDENIEHVVVSGIVCEFHRRLLDYSMSSRRQEQSKKNDLDFPELNLATEELTRAVLPFKKVAQPDLANKTKGLMKLLSTDPKEIYMGNIVDQLNALVAAKPDFHKSATRHLQEVADGSTRDTELKAALLKHQSTIESLLQVEIFHETTTIRFETGDEDIWRSSYADFTYDAGSLIRHLAADDGVEQSSWIAELSASLGQTQAPTATHQSVGSSKRRRR